MFVSSYSTYINANAVDASTRNKRVDKPSADSLFNSKLFKKPSADRPLTKFPIDYISKNKVLNTKAHIQQHLEQNSQITKFTTISSQIKASSAYTANSTMFSLMIKHQPALKPNALNTNQNLPQEIKDIKESLLRNKMLNTYISNDNYYQITA